MENKNENKNELELDREVILERRYLREYNQENGVYGFRILKILAMAIDRYCEVKGIKPYALWRSKDTSPTVCKSFIDNNKDILDMDEINKIYRSFKGSLIWDKMVNEMEPRRRELYRKLDKLENEYGAKIQERKKTRREIDYDTYMHNNIHPSIHPYIHPCMHDIHNEDDDDYFYHEFEEGNDEIDLEYKIRYDKINDELKRLGDKFRF